MFSIIVSIYNVKSYLKKCIDSILSQKYRNFELILVDDGSTDGCSEICDEYAKNDSRIKVIHKNNGGLISTRKAGLEISKNDYICFVDGDDFVSYDMLEIYDKLLSKEKYDVICCGLSIYYDDEHIKSMKQNIEFGSYNKIDLASIIYPKMLSTDSFFHFGVIPSIVAKCFKRNILLKIYEIVPDDISLGEDVAVTYKALLKSNSVYFLDYYGYMYRQNLNSITHSYDKDLYFKIKTLFVYLNQVKKDECWPANQQIDEYTVYLLVLAKNNEFKYNDSNFLTKRNNMKKYLNDLDFKMVLKTVRLKGFKNKLMLFCFKHKFLLLIYFMEIVMKMRHKNG